MEGLREMGGEGTAGGMWKEGRRQLQGRGMKWTE